MKNYDETDPIKEVNGNGFFNKLHSFEENDEYVFEKEMKEYEETYKKSKETNSNMYYNNTKKASEISAVKEVFTYFKICAILIAFAVIISIVNIEIYDLNYEEQAVQEEIYANEHEEEIYYSNEYEENDYIEEYYTSAYYINFDDYEPIPTVYQYGNYDKYYYFKESMYDPRFKTNTSIIEIRYDDLPLYNIIQYKEELYRCKYQQVGIYDGGDIFIKQVDEDYFLFVIICEDFAIYGCGSGDYNKTFDLK